MAHQRLLGQQTPPQEPQKHQPCCEKDVRALDDMSPFQEVCNAVTMWCPSLVALFLWLQPPSASFWGPRTMVLTFAILLHVPFSTIYHLLLACRSLHDAVDNLPRRLDQMFVHVASVMITWAVSTNNAYTGVSLLANFFFIMRLWVKGSSAFERMINIGIGTLIYGLAGLFRGDIWNFTCGTSWFLTGAVAMELRLRGWGHSIMHVCLGGLMYHCMLSAGQIDMQF